MAGTEGVMGRTVEEEFERDNDREGVCVRDRSGYASHPRLCEP